MKLLTPISWQGSRRIRGCDPQSVGSLFSASFGLVSVAANMRTLSTLITAATAIQYACAAAQPRAHIKAGTLLGGHCSNNADAVFFKAVPCGEPPVGKLRLEAPEPYIKSYSHGVLNATTPAPSCIQFDGSSVDPILESEDWYVRR